MGMNVVKLADRMRTEGDAYRFVEELRWGDGEPVCAGGEELLAPRSVEAPVLLVDDDARFTFNNRSALFREHFVAIVQRTGKHTPAGDLFTNFGGPGIDLSNHEAGRWLEAQVRP